MEEHKTVVELSLGELQTLIELATIASGRLSVAEQLFYDALLTRFSKQLVAQTPIPTDDIVPNGTKSNS